MINKHFLATAILMAAAAFMSVGLMAKDVISLNEGWHYSKGTARWYIPLTGRGQQAPQTPTITLPHTFNQEDFMSDEGYYRGEGTYTRELEIPESYKGKRIFLRFEGAGAGGITPKFLAEGVLGGQQYAIPFMRSSEALYINRQLVEKLGYEIPDIPTWDWIWEVSSAAIAYGKEEDGTFRLNGQKTLYPFIYKSTDNMMIQMTEQRGTGYATDYGKILLFNEASKDIIRTVAEHTEDKSFITFKVVSYPGNYFNAGQCIFAIDSTAGATWIGPDAPLSETPEDKTVECDTVIRPIPQYDPESPKMISQGPSVCIFNKEDPGEVLASWLFVQFLLTDKVQISYSQTEGYIPVTEHARSSAEYLDYLAARGTDNELHYSVKIDASKLVIDNIGNTFITPVFVGSASLREAAGELIEGTVRQIRKGRPVDDEFIEELYSHTISLKRLNLDGNAAGQKAELGPLPKTSVVLLCVLGAAWLMIGAGYLTAFVRKKKKSKSAVSTK